MSRNSKLARIHLAKLKAETCSSCGKILFCVSGECPECGCMSRASLKDQEYRKLLESLTGKTSCHDMNDNQLRKVMDLFDRAGFAKAYPYEPPPERKQKYAVIRQIERRAKIVLGPGWAIRVDGFCTKTFGKSGLTNLNPVQLRNVIGWINRLDKSQKKKAGETK
ncbi:phage protein GemA/Gp16 family protein [uncultured Sphaerochaeta sp.]|uniref:phage protein GemA/Gp16 family protein n=1 Tax=uncultured Sphaerochaeta sp. TaxID=886478 RepID=UPI002A0A833B|nr:phage protein GemA/Gp16 family protein [uncultured Sphaerochaeta sp.]